MPATRLYDVDIYGTANFVGPVNLPTNTVDNDDVEVGAGISASKLEHQHQPTWGQNGTAAAHRQVIHKAEAAGTITGAFAGSRTKAVGDSTTTIDILKNGTTILTAPIVLDNGNTNNVAEDGTLSVTSYAAGDIIEINQTISAGTGTLPVGTFAGVVLREAAA